MTEQIDKLKKDYEPRPLSVTRADRQLTRARFSPCGKFLIAGCYDQTVRRWQVQMPQAQEPQEEKKPEKRPQPEFKKKKKPEAQTGPKLIEWKRVTGHNGWVTALAFAPKGDLIYTADSWGQLRCWAYADENPKPKWTVKQAHDGWIRHLTVSSDGKRIATVGRDQHVRVWSADKGRKQLDLTGHDEDIYSASFSPDNKQLLSGDLKGAIQQWSLTEGKPVRRFDAGALFTTHRIQEVGGVRVLRFLDDGKTLLAAGIGPETGGFVKGAPVMVLFDYQTGKMKKQIKIGASDQGYVFDVHEHPAGFLMFVASGQPGKGLFALMRLSDDKPFYQTTKMANCHNLVMHPDGSHFAVTATNSGSNGNGRRLDKDGNYVGNLTPIHLFAWPQVNG